MDRGDFSWRACVVKMRTQVAYFVAASEVILAAAVDVA